jgi:tetratricopeptide (TPR) repeat protein
MCYYLLHRKARGLYQLFKSTPLPPTKARDSTARMDLSTKQGRREQGQRIQRAVERAGLSIEELASRIGCSRALIYQYLSGTTLAQPDRLQQIAGECGVTLASFYSATDAPEDQAPSSDPGLPAPPPTVAVSVPISLPPQEVAVRLNEGLRSMQELAAAQEGSPDYRALSATCERILSLAAQVGDRSAQAVAQLRLGNALVNLADYPRAADALARAVTLAQEIGAAGTETSARQSLGQALFQLGRTDEAGEQFAHIAAGTDFAGRWQGTLSLGSIHEQRGEYQQAMLRFDEAANILEEGEANGTARPETIAVGLLYVNANRTNVYLDEGDFRGARPLAEKCLGDAESLGIAGQHLEARFNIAWCDFGVGRWAACYAGLTGLLQLARFIGDQGRETMTRAWLGIFLAAAGDRDGALNYGKDALAQALSHGDRRAELYAQLALADAYSGDRLRQGEARYHVTQALAVARAVRDTRAEIECRLRLAHLSSQSGTVTELRDAATRALTAAQRLGARHLECLARIRVAEALAREPNADPSAARGEAEVALAQADSLALIEGQWRARYTLAQILLEGDIDAELAEAVLIEAVALLESLRAALIETGIPDTLLENEECIAVYVRVIQLIRQSGRTREADALLEQAGWPPLNARVAAMAEPAAPTLSRGAQ